MAEKVADVAERPVALTDEELTVVMDQVADVLTGHSRRDALVVLAALVEVTLLQFDEAERPVQATVIIRQLYEQFIGAARDNAPMIEVIPANALKH